MFEKVCQILMIPCVSFLFISNGLSQMVEKFLQTSSSPNKFMKQPMTQNSLFLIYLTSILQFFLSCSYGDKNDSAILNGSIDQQLRGHARETLTSTHHSFITSLPNFLSTIKPEHLKTYECALVGKINNIDDKKSCNDLDSRLLELSQDWVLPNSDDKIPKFMILGNVFFYINNSIKLVDGTFQLEYVSGVVELLDDNVINFKVLYGTLPQSHFMVFPKYTYSINHATDSSPSRLNLKHLDETLTLNSSIPSKAYQVKVGYFRFKNEFFERSLTSID